MRINWELSAYLGTALCVFVTLFFFLDRAAERQHLETMASCTTTIPKTDSARVGAD